MSALPYSFFRPLLAADRHWAAVDWQSTAADTADGIPLAAGLCEIRATKLAARLPVVAMSSLAAYEEAARLDDGEAQQLIFVFPEASLDDPQMLAQCAELRRRGRHLAVRIEHPEMLCKVPGAAFDYLAGSAFDYLSIDAVLARQELSASQLAYADEAGVRLIASQVNAHEMFGWLTDKGFAWCDSHFLSAHNPLNAREPDLTRLKLLRLLTLVKQDGDTRALEEIFREEPKLSYNLLRLVNSVAFNTGTKISNFAQAITILGRRQLQRWLQMLVYADHLADGDTPNPLLQLAALRARQMELLSAALVPQPEIAELSDNAFMVGLFSLLEVLINLPMKEILKELPMHDATIDALLHRRRGGVLGRLLAAVMASESGEFASAEALLRELGIAAATHTRAQLDALHWALSINIADGLASQAGAPSATVKRLGERERQHR
jgi:EAL and modified HD-GYP domain-containing signal transduction protein